jgi:uncharacterized protein YjbI with pentapeptide repeats
VRELDHKSGQLRVSGIEDPAPEKRNPETNPSDAPTYSAKATDPLAWRDAVSDAATVGGGLWLSYLFVFFYLAIAAGGVTHRDLLFENPVKLPFLNTELPLIGFFSISPLIFLVVHAYVLLHFAMLSSKVDAYNRELEKHIGDQETMVRLRRQLPSNIFIQLLAGPPEFCAGFFGFTLRLIASISLIWAPILLLSFFVVQFLPFQDWKFSWWQRIIVVLDLALLWEVSSFVKFGGNSAARRQPVRWKIALWVLATSVPILFVFTIATFPGEWLDRSLPSIRFIPTSWPIGNWRSLHELLVAGPVDYVTRRPRSLFSNRLVLQGVTLPKQTKAKEISENQATSPSISFRGRSLEGAVLVDAVLPRADFTGARLTGALLDRADLRGAIFGCARTGQDEYINFNRLPQCAVLRDASLKSAQMQGAILDGALLEGANFENANLQGASFVHAQLTGAWLWSVRAQGASFIMANLRGASLVDAHLQAALLQASDFQGALLDGAQLQGAALSCEGPLATRFPECLAYQGNLGAAGFGAASLQEVYVWRTAPPSYFEAYVKRNRKHDTFIVNLQTGQSFSSLSCRSLTRICDWSANEFLKLQKDMQSNFLPGKQKERALDLIQILDPRRDVREESNQAPSAWSTAARFSPEKDDYYRTLGLVLKNIACRGDEGSKYAIIAIIERIARQINFGGATRDLAIPLAHAVAGGSSKCVSAAGRLYFYKLRILYAAGLAKPGMEATPTRQEYDAIALYSENAGP